MNHLSFVADLPRGFRHDQRYRWNVNGGHDVIQWTIQYEYDEILITIKDLNHD